MDLNDKKTEAFSQKNLNVANSEYTYTSSATVKPISKFLNNILAT